MSRHPDVPTITAAMRGTVVYDPPSSDEPRFTADSIVKKRVFTLPEFELESGEKLRDVKIGYECYGRLNDQRDNGILILHYFTGTSHAAGRYHTSDAEPGYWDSIIGPGKAIDTDKFFVIGVDCLANLNTGNPMVFSPGPLSRNPATGRAYGGEFPILTIGDFVRSQYALCQYLGLPSLYAVAGPSMGSMQAMEWAARFPDYVTRVIGAIGGGLQTEPYLIGLVRQWCAPIYVDAKFNGGNYDPADGPIDGLAAALELVTLTALSPGWANRAFARRPADKDNPPESGLQNLFSVENALSVTARARAAIADANSFLRIAKAVQLFDVMPMKDRLKARFLWIHVRTDLLLYPEYAERGIHLLRELGLEVTSVQLDSPGGHLDGLGEIKAAAPQIELFLRN